MSALAVKAREASRNANGQLVEIKGSSLKSPSIDYEPGAEEGERWYLTKPYLWTYAKTDVVHRRVSILIPKGFRFDLASIPRALWSIIAPFELSIVAPLVHDMLYRSGGSPPIQWYKYGINEHLSHIGVRHKIWNRGESDSEFLGLMDSENIAWWRRYSAYAAVRSWGWTAWQESEELL